MTRTATQAAFGVLYLIMHFIYFYRKAICIGSLRFFSVSKKDGNDSHFPK